MQNKRKERGRGGESTPNPTLAGRRARAQSKTRNKAKPTSSETTEAGQRREGTQPLLGERGERERTGWVGRRKEQRGKKDIGKERKRVSTAPMDPPGRLEGAPS